MGKNKAGEAFDVAVSSTDNDTHEQFALQQNWEFILLLLWIFDIWQSWRNGLNKHLRIIPKGEDCQSVWRRLGQFLMRLLKEISEYDKALAAYNEELTYFKDLSKSWNTTTKKQEKGGIAFLTYLQFYLKLQNMWHLWSIAGAMEAAERLGIPLGHVAQTTNHLMSFNGRLKGSCFAPYMRSGRLPRIDYWILILVTEALLTFFKEWAEKRDRKHYYNQMQHAPIRSHIPAIQPQSHKASPTSDDRPTAAPTTTPLTPEEAVKEAREWVVKVLGHKPSKGQAQKIAAEETELAMAAIEDQLVEQLEEDGLDESLTDDEDEDVDDPEEDVDDPEEMEGYGTELKMGDSGEESFSSSSADGDHVVTPNSDSLSLMVADVALDKSAIIQNLDTNIDIAFLFTSAQPTSHSDSNSIHLFFPTSNNKLPLPIIEDALPDIQISAPHSEPHSN
jgi:hypothetical protein